MNFKPTNQSTNLKDPLTLIARLRQLAKKSDCKALWFPYRQNAVNSPLTTTLTDFTTNGNTVTLTNLAGTISDGYENTPIISDMGSDVLFKTLVNGDFETGTNVGTNFKISGAGTSVWSLDSTVKYTGTKSQKIVVSIGSNGIEFLKDGLNYVPVVVGKQYYFSCFTKVSAGSSINLGSSAYGTQYGVIAFASETDFSIHSRLLTATTDKLYMYTTSGVGTHYFDALNIFCITDIFHDANNRPTQEQMDRLVQQAISIYGYINEVKIKLLWQTGLKADGADTYGSVVDNGSLDFIGTQNFAFTGVFVTPSVLQIGYVFSKNNDTSQNVQYGLLFVSPTQLVLKIGDNNDISVPSVMTPLTLYKFTLIRNSGVLTFYLNGVKLIDTTSLISLASRPNLRLFARSSNASGTTQSAFGKLTMLQLTAHGSNVTEASLLAFTNKAQQPYKATINAFTTV